MKKSSIVNYIFVAIGFCLLVGAFFSYQNSKFFLQGSISANGTVIAIDRSSSPGKKGKSPSYHPVISFTTESGEPIEFRSSTGRGKNTYTKGQIIEVLYQQAAPRQARMNSFFSLWGATLILAGLGAVFFALGYSIIFFSKRKEKKIVYLKKHGISVEATFNNVAVNTSLKVNGKSPYQIIAHWQDPKTSSVHQFNSDNIWFDPTNYVKAEKITVLTERNNPKKYHVDIDFLPEVVD